VQATIQVSLRGGKNQLTTTLVAHRECPSGNAVTVFPEPDAYLDEMTGRDWAIRREQRGRSRRSRELQWACTDAFWRCPLHMRLRECASSKTWRGLVSGATVALDQRRAFRRNDCGGSPKRRKKVRRIRSGSEKPTAAAILSTGSASFSIRSRATSALSRSTALAGVSPVSALNSLPNWRELKQATSASRSTDSDSVRCSLA